MSAGKYLIINNEFDKVIRFYSRPATVTFSIRDRKGNRYSL